jgi:hypothetical protein
MVNRKTDAGVVFATFSRSEPPETGLVKGLKCLVLLGSSRGVSDVGPQKATEDALNLDPGSVHAHGFELRIRRPEFDFVSEPE